MFVQRWLHRSRDIPVSAWSLVLILQNECRSRHRDSKCLNGILFLQFCPCTGRLANSCYYFHPPREFFFTFSPMQENFLAQYIQPREFIAAGFTCKNLSFFWLELNPLSPPPEQTSNPETSHPHVDLIKRDIYIKHLGVRE